MKNLALTLAAYTLFASGTALAEAPLPCATAFDIQACPDGTGEQAAVKEAARLFQRTCQSIQKNTEAVPGLKGDCESAAKSHDLPGCTDRWDKLYRTLSDLNARANKEQADLEKTFNALVSPYTCSAAELNKNTLRELKQRYLTIQTALASARTDAGTHNSLFQDALTKTLLSHKSTDSGKHYLGILGAEGRAQPTADQVASMGSVELVTAYRLALEFDYPGPKDAVILVSGAEVKVTAGFAKKLKLEGAGVLDDGRMVNSTGKNYVWVRIIDAPYGLGSYKRTPLEPYRSIAVDPKVIPLGSIVFIYEARGMPLPPAADGTTLFHDGFFRAIDVGSMINGTHIDVYAGHTIEDYRFIQKYFDGKTVHFYVMKP